MVAARPSAGPPSVRHPAASGRVPPLRFRALRGGENCASPARSHLPTTITGRIAAFASAKGPKPTRRKPPYGGWLPPGLRGMPRKLGTPATRTAFSDSLSKRPGPTHNPPVAVRSPWARFAEPSGDRGQHAIRTLHELAQAVPPRLDESPSVASSTPGLTDPGLRVVRIASSFWGILA